MPMSDTGLYTASTADKYALYQLSVQSPEADVRFLAHVYQRERGRPARHLREDFSGTALLASHWIRRGRDFTAEAFDIDPEPLEWGRRHNLAPLGGQASRALLHQADVRATSHRAPDIRCAQNFSYWALRTRAQMPEYFTAAYEDLDAEGIFVLDAHGGPESLEQRQEETRIAEGFTYVRDRAYFSPVTHDARLFIHFHFPDGSRMQRAFRYEWRVWSIPEIRDILTEAGFGRVDCYWEGTAADGEGGNGVFRKTRYGTNDLSWIAYPVAPKQTASTQS